MLVQERLESRQGSIALVNRTSRLRAGETEMEDRDQPSNHSVAGDLTSSPDQVDLTIDLSSTVATASSPPKNTDSTDWLRDYRYQLIDEIARGGMGVIWRATDNVLGREVAVKVLQSGYDPDSGVARRFADEAHISAQLQHPAIPPVHDFGTLPGGQPFLAMKLIRGHTLEQLLRQRSDPATERGRFIAVFEQTCQAVAYAHAHNVIHRDLKPSNIMVGSFGEVQVMDWGLAKVLSPNANSDDPDTHETTVATVIRGSDGNSSNPSFTQAGSILGTLAYMAPEQAAGEVSKIGPHSDVFGLGAILTVILTGRPPYEGADTGSLRVMAIRGDLNACLGRLDNCGAEPGLVALCKRCLAFDPAHRPRDAGAVAQEVANLRSEAEQRAQEAEKERAAAEIRVAEQKKRRRTQRALALTIGLLVVGTGAVAWWADRQAGERRADALRREVENQQREREDALRAEAERSRFERNAQVVETLLGQCEDSLRADDADRAAVQLDLAARRLEDGGAANLRPRFARCAADLTVLQDLNRIDELRWTETGGQLASDAKLSESAAAAFAQYGLVPGQSPPDAAARQVNASPVRDRLLTALDLWLGWARATDGAMADGLSALLRAVDPDPYRTSVRDATRAGQETTLQQLSEQPEALNQPTWFASVFGQRSAIPVARRGQILRATHLRRPDDLTLLMTLGQLDARAGKERAAECVGWCRAAIAIRPKNAAPWNGLGIALAHVDDLDGAEAALRQAILFNTTSVRARTNLANVFYRRGNLDAAEAAYREAIRINPTLPNPLYNLGLTLRQKKDYAGAEAELREAVRVDPTYAPAQVSLADILRLRGDLDESVAAFEECLRLNPSSAPARVGLALALLDRGDFANAVENLREACRLEPGNETYLSTLKRAEQKLALLHRLHEVADGREKPETPAEAVELAQLGAHRSQKRYSLAVRLYEEAFAGNADLAADLGAGHRYSAARNALLAASGADAGAPVLEDNERTRLIGLALTWLRADLALITTHAEDPERRPQVAEWLTRWKNDPELASVRDPEAMASMPADKRKAWEALWSEVDTLLAPARAVTR